MTQVHLSLQIPRTLNFNFGLHILRCVYLNYDINSLYNLLKELKQFMDEKRKWKLENVHVSKTQIYHFYIFLYLFLWYNEDILPVSLKVHCLT